MTLGHYISGTGHAALIGWVIFGGVFRSTPPEFEVSNVSVITAEQFENLQTEDVTPGAVTDVTVPTAPDVNETAPAIETAVDDRPATQEPDVAETAEPDATPDVSETALPDPQPIEEEAPSLVQPVTDLTALLPDVGESAAPQDAPRVAPTPVAQPEPDVTIDEAPQEATEPSESADTPAPEQEETAPEAATTEIVTEATEVATAAPAKSVRPKVRPKRREPEPTPEPEPANPDDSIAAALAAAGAEEVSETSTTPTGPPLSGAEKEGLRVSVQSCWNVDVGSQAANVTVTIAMSMNRDGTVIGSSLRMIAADGGSESAVRTAYETARRAVLRCQKGGYPLPIEKYEHWREIEMTFNPDSMRIR